jgi:regulator of replication initiation timing
VSLPAFMQYVNPLLAALRKLGGAGRPPKVFQLIRRELTLSNEVLSERLRSGGSRFENQVAWARWYLVNAGFIDGSRRGVWKLTERGWESEFLGEEALRAVFEHTQSRYRGAGEEAEEEETPETTADEMDVEKLKELYASDTAAQCFLDHAASRQRNQSETTVDRALQILRNDGHHVTRQKFISVLQSLEECGCGRFVTGRRGWPSRFVWSTAMISVGRAATGEQEDVEEYGGFGGLDRGDAGDAVLDGGGADAAFVGAGAFAAGRVHHQRRSCRRSCSRSGWDALRRSS